MELSSYNINVQTVADEVMVIQSLVLALLSLFEGYLALGLIVGVAGIGVVTVRNVSERRQTVGMLRAIGFRQRHVLRMFSIEVSWVAVLGMLNGLAVGYGFHLLLFKSLWEAEGVVFSFPWVTTLGLFGFGWMVVLLNLCSCSSGRKYTSFCSVAVVVKPTRILFFFSSTKNCTNAKPSSLKNPKNFGKMDIFAQIAP